MLSASEHRYDRAGSRLTFVVVSYPSPGNVSDQKQLTARARWRGLRVLRKHFWSEALLPVTAETNPRGFGFYSRGRPTRRRAITSRCACCVPFADVESSPLGRSVSMELDGVS